MFRPPVKDLEFHLYSRPVHPELFEILALRDVRQGDYRIRVRLTPSGHVLTVQTPEFWLTEVTAVRDQPLPAQGHLLRHRFRGEKSDSLTPAPAFAYHSTSQVEELPEAIFERVQDEIIAGGRKGGLLFRFDSRSRVFLAPISYMSVQAGRGMVSITALHTFPGENTVVKTISLLEKL